MDIISVEHLPPLTVVSKGRAIRPNTEKLPQNTPSQQARNTPPLTMVSKGKAIVSNAAASDNLLMQRVTNLPPLAYITKSKGFNVSAPKQKGSKPAKQRIQNGNIPRLQLKPAQKQLTLKKFDNVTAPAPFFGPFKSQIPKGIKIPLPTQQKGPMPQSRSFVDEELASNMDVTIEAIEWPQKQSLANSRNFITDDIENPQNQSLVESDNFMTDEIEWHQSQSLVDTDNFISDEIKGGTVNFEYPTDVIIETADKATQTECFYQCNSNDHGTKQALEEGLAKVMASLNDLKLNITGKTATKMMSGLFPIKSEAELRKIDYNMENTENFELRLKLFLKYLKPKNSAIITTAFKELFGDEFLKDKNWDGSNDLTALNKYTFFETTLFDAWKNSVFTKDVYIAAMKQEIKKAHDRENKRKRKRTA